VIVNHIFNFSLEFIWSDQVSRSLGWQTTDSIHINHLSFSVRSRKSLNLLSKLSCNNPVHGINTWQDIGFFILIVSCQDTRFVFISAFTHILSLNLIFIF